MSFYAYLAIILFAIGLYYLNERLLDYSRRVVLPSLIVLPLLYTLVLWGLFRVFPQASWYRTLLAIILGLGTPVALVVGWVFLGEKVPGFKSSDEEIERRQKAQERTCAGCGATIVKGLREQVAEGLKGSRIGVTGTRKDGKSYGGACRQCGKNYCWSCARQHALSVSEGLLPGVRMVVTGPIMDESGLMVCPGCKTKNLRAT